MKIVEVMQYLVIFNATLWFFNRIGIYSAAAALGVPIAGANGWGITGLGDLISLGGFTNIAAMGLGLLTMVIAMKGGVNPFLAMAYGAVTGVFLNIIVTNFQVMYSIATIMGDQKDLMLGIIAILVTVYAIQILWGLIQMSIGGGKSYE